MDGASSTTHFARAATKTSMLPITHFSHLTGVTCVFVGREAQEMKDSSKAADAHPPQFSFPIFPDGGSPLHQSNQPEARLNTRETKFSSNWLF